MGRAAQFNREELVTLAIALAAAEGPTAVTMQRVGASAKASNGSVYHRFGSRAELLAAVWLAAVEQFQADWWARVEGLDEPGEVAVAGVRWARSHRDLAKILLLHRAEDFLSDQTPAALREEAARLASLTNERWRRVSQHFLGSDTSDALERTRFAFALLPLGALRRYLSDDKPITAVAEGLVREAAVALMAHRRTHD